MLLGIAWYHLWKRRKDGIDTVDERATSSWAYRVLKPGRSRLPWLAFIISLGRLDSHCGLFSTAFTGHEAQMMIEQQPLKMASAEAACRWH